MNNLIERITTHHFFHGMKPAHLKILTERATEASFESGQVIFRQGEPADQFYLIESGKVVLEAHEPANGTVPVQTLGPGEVLGWSWLYPPFNWNFQARALEPTGVIVLNGGHLLVASERDREFGFELMKRISQMVIHRLQATRHRLIALSVESTLTG